MVVKTGDVIPDRIYIRRNETDDTFSIHFPSLIANNPASIGVTVTVTFKQLKELWDTLDHVLTWTCPTCGKHLSNYRRSELDWGHKRCEYCGWEEDN